MKHTCPATYRCGCDCGRASATHCFHLTPRRLRRQERKALTPTPMQELTQILTLDPRYFPRSSLDQRCPVVPRLQLRVAQSKALPWDTATWTGMQRGYLLPSIGVASSLKVPPRLRHTQGPRGNQAGMWAAAATGDREGVDELGALEALAAAESRSRVAGGDVAQWGPAVSGVAACRGKGGAFAPCTPDLQDPDSQFPALLPKPTDGTPRAPPALAMLSRAEDGEDEGAEAAIDEGRRGCRRGGGRLLCGERGCGSMPFRGADLRRRVPELIPPTLPPSLRTSVLTMTMATMTTLMTAAGTTPSTDGPWRARHGIPAHHS